MLGASQHPGIHATMLAADGSYNELLYATHILPSNQDCKSPYAQMKGNEVFKVAVSKLGQMVVDILKENGFQQSDVTWLIPHQANLRIINSVAKKLSLPLEKVVITIDEQGNTSAASIPLALDVAVRDGRVKRGDLLLCESFGGGFTWGSALITY